MAGKIIKNTYDLNNILKNYKLEKNELEEKYPNIFIIGVPRSGTTLLNQLIASSTDVGYINNLIVRFWDAPFIGAILSKELGLNKNIEFTSDHGFTRGITNVHEFGFFWKKYFNSTWERDSFLDEKKGQEIDWKNWTKDILRLNCIYEKPFVFKAINIIPYIKYVKKYLQKAVFIVVERDAYDVASSILKVRKRRKGNVNEWWSFKPINVEKIKQYSSEEQVCYQIYYIANMIKKNLESTHHIKTTYEKICKNSGQELQNIIDFIKKNFNYELNILNNPPNFQISRRRIEKSELLKYLKKYELK